MGKIVKSTDRNGQITYPVTIDDAVVCTDINGKQTLKQKMNESGMNVLAKAEYKEFVSSSNTSGADGAMYGFLKVVPTDYNKPLTVRYRITITPSASATNANKNLINGVYDVELVITRGAIAFNTFCKFASTTYYPIRYSVYYYLSTEDGINNGYGHLLGIYAYNSYLPTDATLKRDLKVEVLHISGGTFELSESISTFVSRADYSATYHTTKSYVSAVIGAYHSGDQNTTYTINYLYDAGVQKAGIGTNAISRYVLVMQKPDLTWEKIVDTSASYSTGTAKKVNTRGFLLGRLKYYNTTTVVANGGTAAANSFSSQAATFDMRYSTNCGTPADWVAGNPTFLVGTIGSDGLFYLDSTKWWSNALPTTEDGKIYMQIGTVVTSASYSSTLLIDHPCYRYVNGAVERYYQGLDEKQDVITDLETIRSGASAGATAVQPDAISDMETKTNASQTYQPKGNYLTTHQDISGKAEASEATYCIEEGEVTAPTFEETLMAAVANKADKANTYTKTEVDSLIASVDGGGSGGGVSSGVISVNGQTGVVNLSIPTKVSQLQNDSKFITSSALTPYAQSENVYTKDDVYTKSEADAKFALIGSGGGGSTPSGGVTSVNGQTGAVTLTIPTKVSQLQNDSNFLTEHQSLAGYATVGSVQSLQSAIDAITGVGNTSQAIDAMNEIIAFLDTYKNSDSLASVLSAFESTLHTWVENKNYTTKSYVDGLVGNVESLLEALL